MSGNLTQYRGMLVAIATVIPDPLRMVATTGGKVRSWAIAIDNGEGGIVEPGGIAVNGTAAFILDRQSSDALLHVDLAAADNTDVLSASRLGIPGPLAEPYLISEGPGGTIAITEEDGDTLVLVTRGASGTLECKTSLCHLGRCGNLQSLAMVHGGFVAVSHIFAESYDLALCGAEH